MRTRVAANRRCYAKKTQNPSCVLRSAQSTGSREALRINVLALSCCGWRPLTIAVVMSGASQGSRRSV